MSARQMRRGRERAVQRGARSGHLNRWRGAGATAAALGASAIVVPGAEAAIFTVDSLDDPGDGTCDPTECTLREAIEDANQAAGADTVLFTSSLSGTIHLELGEIDVYDGALDIQGPGPGVITVDGDRIDRIFDLYGFDGPSTPARISGLTLREGRAGDGGGAIRNSPSGYGPASSLTVEDTVIIDSVANNSGGGAIAHYGGAAENLIITDSRISGNEAEESGGGIAARGSSITIAGSEVTGNTTDYRGGGLYARFMTGDDATPAVLVADSEISRNHAHGSMYLSYDYPGDGGGMFVDSINGPVVVERTTISYNEAGTMNSQPVYLGAGGGVVVGATRGTLISGSTIAGNTSNDHGGGLVVSAPSGEGSFVVENSSISGNEVLGHGGGAYVTDASGGPIAFTNTTITDNEATGPGSVGGGVFAHGDAGDVDVVSAIVAENGAGASGPDLATGTGDSLFDLSFSLVGDIGDADYTDGGMNVIGDEDAPIDPLLAPLGDNGGPVETHLPLAGSPALDAGISNGLATDQRGLPRTFDLPEVANAAGSDATDMGSVEAQGDLQQPPGEQPIEQPTETGECDGSQAALEVGTPAGEALIGTPGSDLIRGAAGSDEIDGLGADDCLFGEADGDRLKGNAGEDTLAGGSENDALVGGGGADVLRGEAGRDRLRGAEAGDRLRGGGGGDKLKGAGGDDKLTGGPGEDRMNCGGGDDAANAGPGDTVSESCETVT